MELDEKTLRAIFHSIPEGMLVADLDSKVVAINGAYQKMFKEDPERFVGYDFEKIKPNSRLSAAIRTGIVLSDYIAQKDLVHDYEKDVCYTVFPIYSDGEIIGGVASYRDISEVTDLVQKYKRTISRYANEIRSQHKANVVLSDIIGESRAIKQVKAVIQRVAVGNQAIMLRGESGTGKELFASALHNESLRAREPFVVVNSPSLTETLAESELFGYEEGSFSGALRGGKIGLFEAANHGTVFLDEIGDLSLNLQAKILRVLESGVFFRVGGNKPVAVDCRLIVATNKNLEQMIRSNEFREDLYYRLNVIQVDIPSLREREKDVLLIANHYAKTWGGLPKTLDEEVARFFLQYDWPGNVRQLRNAVYTMCNFADGDVLHMSHLPEKLKAATVKAQEPERPSAGAPANNIFSELGGWQRREAAAICQLLEEHGRSVAAKRAIAAKLNMGLSTLYGKIKEYGISKRS